MIPVMGRPTRVLQPWERIESGWAVVVRKSMEGQRPS